MKYVSEITGKTYDTEAECLAAETAEAKRKAEQKAIQEKKTAERKAMAEKVEAARKEMVAAQKNYRDAVDAFVKAYGTYHFSSSKIEDIPTLFSAFNPFRFFD